MNENLNIRDVADASFYVTYLAQDLAFILVAYFYQGTESVLCVHVVDVHNVFYI
jgi:hypothetical protein